MLLHVFNQSGLSAESALKQKSNLKIQSFHQRKLMTVLFFPTHLNTDSTSCKISPTIKYLVKNLRLASDFIYTGINERNDENIVKVKKSISDPHEKEYLTMIKS